MDSPQMQNVTVSSQSNAAPAAASEMPRFVLASSRAFEEKL
jgi:hypothetical protein